MEIKLSCRLDYCARHLYKLDCANVKMDCAKTNINVESDCAKIKIYTTALSIQLESLTDPKISPYIPYDSMTAMTAIFPCILSA